MTSPKSIFSSNNFGISEPCDLPGAKDDDIGSPRQPTPLPTIAGRSTISSAAPLASAKKHHLGPSSAIDVDPKTKRRRRIQPDSIRDRIRSLSGQPDTRLATDPPSPLFFSHRKRLSRPALPPRFSSGEAGARMLSKACDSESHVKTVTLARGNYTDLSPAGPGFLQVGSRSISEKSSVPHTISPDVSATLGLRPSFRYMVGLSGTTNPAASCRQLQSTILEPETFLFYSMFSCLYGPNARQCQTGSYRFAD
jgi:hypothetical protein